jgi:hypothetical protein
VTFVIYGGHATDYLAGSVREKQLHPSVLIERIFLRVELLTLIDQKRRHPMGIVPILLEWVSDEPLYVRSGIDAPDANHDAGPTHSTAKRSCTSYHHASCPTVSLAIAYFHCSRPHRLGVT